jgi:hypothetical protein
LFGKKYDAIVDLNAAAERRSLSPRVHAVTFLCLPTSFGRDRKQKKFVGAANDKKMIRTESGHRIPITYKSDRYKEWADKNNASR